MDSTSTAALTATLLKRRSAVYLEKLPAVSPNLIVFLGYASVSAKKKTVLI